MLDETRALPEFDSLYAALKYDFEEIQRESDPFRRLAWLIERQESYFQQTGRGSRVSEILGLPSTEVLLEDCEKALRDYYELRCEPGFPRRLIQQGIKPATRRDFLTILGEVEKGDPDFGIDFDDEAILDEIEYWSGFQPAGLTSQPPRTGLDFTLNELYQARNRLEEPGISRGDIFGQVIDAFVQAESLLRQLLSFYGRAFYGPDYIDAILQQYHREAKEKAQHKDGMTSLPELVDELGKLLELGERERENAVRDFLEGLLRAPRKVKFLAREAKRLHDLQEKKKGLGFLGYTQVLHSLDRWIWRACESPQSDEEQERGQNFEWIFQRRRLFPSQAEAGKTVSAPAKEGNRLVIKTVDIVEQNTSPFVEVLRLLNRVRPLYAHEGDPHFVHPSNFENIRDGAKKILDTFITLWGNAKNMIFPSVVLVRRLIQIEPNVMRIDYVPETGSSLTCIRVATTDLPSDIDVSWLLGQEVFLYTRNGQGGMVSVLLLYLVE